MQVLPPDLLAALRKTSKPPKPRWHSLCGDIHVARDGCNLKPTSYGTFARANLIPHLEARHKERTSAA